MWDRDSRELARTIILDGMVETNERWLREQIGKSPCGLTCDTGRLRCVENDREMLSDISAVFMRAYGSEESLVCVAVAELHVSGKDPRARPRLIASGNVYAVVVERGDGRLEAWDGGKVP